METSIPQPPVAPPSPSTSDEMANDPVGIVVHPDDDTKKKGTEHVHFRCIPTRSCVVMGVAIMIVICAMVLSMYLIISDVDASVKNWAVGMLGSIVAVGLIYLKPASAKALSSSSPV